MLLAPAYNPPGVLPLTSLKPGLVVSGLLPDRHVTILHVDPISDSSIEVTFKDSSGHRSSEVLYSADSDRLGLVDSARPWSFSADGADFRLVSEARRIRLAHLFDPYLALQTSAVQPLPHQIAAVYEDMLRRHPLRFLLADDPGAGKTIMAGLLIRELQVRGDVRRCLIVCPGSLGEQWQDELDQKFGLKFDLFSNQAQEASRGNWFDETPLAIARLDKLARDDDLKAKIEATHWDLIVIDEAHKLSASWTGNEVKYTKRYRLGQLLSRQTRHFLLMTATPHNGKPADFQLFMALLDGDRFEGQPRQGAHIADPSDLMRRMVKEKLVKFDGRPLFPERRAYTVNYALSEPEVDLYESVTKYVTEEFNRAEALANEGRKGTVGFALMSLQRRLASSPAAILRSLERRRDRLDKKLREARLSARFESIDAKARGLANEDLDEIEELAPDDREAAESLVDEATAASTVAELEAELATLRGLEEQARRLRASGEDRKWTELAKLLQGTSEMFDPSGKRRKLVVFTEHRDTLDYLVDRVGNLLGRKERVVAIHGALGRDERLNVQERFKNHPDVDVLVATDAAGEGINLQRAHLMINYDLPWNPNRLEQRFGRIHRIGQREVCHLWNLVASETREGWVYDTLLEKLAAEREALGSGVFDVLGRIFEGHELRNLLVEAIRYGDSPEVRAKLQQRVEGAMAHDHLHRLIEDKGLATEGLDPSHVTHIKEQMERIEARRLQPHFVESFFLAAFQKLGGIALRRESRRYKITRVPQELRLQDRVIGRKAPVLDEYERIVFDRDLVDVDKAPRGEFICPGHPLLDVVVDKTLELHPDLLRQGAVLVRPGDPGASPKVLFVIESRIQDAVTSSEGHRRVISRKLEFATIDEQGEIRPAGDAPYLDLQPVAPDDRPRLASTLESPWIRADLEAKVRAWAIEHLVPGHLADERTRRQRLIDKTKAEVHARLNAEITYWDHRAAEEQLREDKAGRPRTNSVKFKKICEDLEARRRARITQLDAERVVSAAPPEVVGPALVIPEGILNELRGKAPKPFSADAEARARIERLAMEAVLAAERRLGFDPVDVSALKCGWDIESSWRDPEGQPRLRLIEVKGRVLGAPTVTITRNELLTALNKPDDYVFALVQVDGTEATVRYRRGPIDFKDNFLVESVNLDFKKLWDEGSEPA